MSERFLRIDLLPDECEAIGVLCDLAAGMLEDLGGTITKAQTDNLKARLNSVRYKMNAATALAAGSPIPGAIDSRIILDVHKRGKH